MPFALLSLLALAATTTNAAPPAQEKEQVIVVTGNSLADTERALRECLARHCPPKDDINAALAHAENLFVAGKYEDARATTLAAIGRNRKYARDLPVDVSDLYRANARIAAHLGQGNDYEWSTGEVHRILTAAFPRTDWRVIDADLEQADMYASFGRTELARQVLERAARKATDAGRFDLASIARVRSAWLYTRQGEQWLARQELQKIAADSSPNNALGRLAAGIVLARMDRNAGDSRSTAALIEQMRALHMRQPVLLLAPKIDLNPRMPENPNGILDVDPQSGNNAALQQIMTQTNLMATDVFEDRWIDVGFWVTPEGKVSEPEILRRHGPTNWTGQLMQSIAGRVYSPIEAPTYRVERYSYTSRWINASSSRIRQRSPNARIEYVDLTATPTASR